MLELIASSSFFYRWSDWTPVDYIHWIENRPLASGIYRCAKISASTGKTRIFSYFVPWKQDKKEDILGLTNVTSKTCIICTFIFLEKTTDLPQVTDKLYHTMLYDNTSPWEGFELTTLEVVGTDYMVSYKSNYRTITTMTAPLKLIQCM